MLKKVKKRIEKSIILFHVFILDIIMKGVDVFFKTKLK